MNKEYLSDKIESIDQGTSCEIATIRRRDTMAFRHVLVFVWLLFISRGTGR